MTNPNVNINTAETARKRTRVDILVFMLDYQRRSNSENADES